MSSLKTKILRSTALLLAGVLVTACGGSGGGGDVGQPLHLSFAVANQTTDDVDVALVNAVQNSSPTVVAAASQRVALVPGQSSTINLDRYFNDPNGDFLRFMPTSSDTTVVTVSIDGCDLIITPQGPGSATVTVTTYDALQSGCRDGSTNQAPQVSSPIANQTLNTSGAALNVDLSTVFTDPDGGALNYLASSSASSIATASINGNALTIQPLSVGSATITITAIDEQGASAQTMVTVTVANSPSGGSNQAPAIVQAIPDRALNASDSPVSFDLGPVFSDPDGGTLSFSASSSDPGVVTAAINGALLLIDPAAAGTATVTVTATDSGSATAQDSFTVTVSGQPSGGNNNPPPATSTVDYYFDDTTLYSYQHGASPASVAVDSRDPTFTPTPVYAGTVSDFHPVYVFYRSSAGTFWRVSTTPGSQSAPQQVSAFNPTRPICFTKRGQDLANPDNAPVVFALLASGQSCSDSARTLDYRVIRVGDNASTPAVVFPQADASSVEGSAIVQLINPSDFSHAGWLVIQRNTQNNEILVRVPANPTGPLTTILTPANGIAEFIRLGMAGNGVVMLSVDGALYSYDVANSTLNDLHFTFRSSFGSIRPRPDARASELGGEFYFVDDNVNTGGGALYRTQAGGTQAPIKIDNRPFCNLSDFGVTLAVGASWVVWSCHSSMAGGATLRSVSKSATQPGAGVIALDTAQGANNEEFGSFTAASDQYVYYNVLTRVAVPNARDFFTVEAKRAALDGSGVTTTPQAKWLNLVLAGRGQTGIVYRLDGLQKLADPVGGKTLVAVSANAPANQVTVGTLPTDAISIVALSFTADNAGIVTIIVDETPTSPLGAGLGDILYIDASVANSLERVTNTSNKFEFAVFGL